MAALNGQYEKAVEITRQPIAERKTPESWGTPLSNTPEPYRSASLACAWNTFDETVAKFALRNSIERRMALNSGVATAFSDVFYASGLPYHLVAEQDVAQACDLLRKGSGNLLQWIKDRNPGADRLLIIGDLPEEPHFSGHLEDILKDKPAMSLVCGPGPTVEKMVRTFAEARNFPRQHIQSLDPDRHGEAWDRNSGAILDGMITRLFEYLKPDRLVAFEPLRLPAIQLTLEAARKRNIPIEYVTPPQKKAFAAPGMGAASHFSADNDLPPF